MPIIVTGNRYTNTLSEYLSFSIPSVLVDFGHSFGVYSANGLTYNQTFTDPENTGTVKFEEEKGRPEIIVTGASRMELAGVVAALENSDNDPGLELSFRVMKDYNVKLVINVVDTPPSDYISDQVGDIEFVKVTNPLGHDDFAPNTTAVITVVGSRLDGSSLEKTFNFALAHELSHLIRDTNRHFLNDDNDSTYSYDNTLYNNLFSKFKFSDFLDSSDVTATFAYTNPQITGGDTYIAYGTSGNNYITSSVAFSHDIIYTGAGNDIISSGYGSDQIFVDMSGIKLIQSLEDTSSVYTIDYLTIDEEIDVRNFNFDRIGDDLYITYDDTPPLLSENSIVIINHFNTGSFSAITSRNGFFDGGFYLLPNNLPPIQSPEFFG